MMHAGRVVLDVSGAEKRSLSVADLVERFHAHGVLSDRGLLTA